MTHKRTNMTYDIFISYKRRGTSSATAAYLYELLLNKGYNVFFDRKEMRSGMFDEQLLNHISDAKDVIILLEDTSLAACFDEESSDYFKSDWFCKEIMHALSQPGKNVIPILLEGYKMPPKDTLPKELQDLSRCQALSLEISEVEEFYQKYFVEMEYLKSMPTNISRFRKSRSNKASISSLLFCYDGYCYDINEYGEYITTIDENNDENHPYKHGVEFAGEHKILCVNNDTFERVMIKIEVTPYHQKYIPIEWNKHQFIWKQTKDTIQNEDDIDNLVFWGKALFEGTRTNKPNLKLSLLCFDKAIKMHSEEAEDFLKNNWTVVCDRKEPWDERVDWIKHAAKLGVIPAMRYLGEALYKKGNQVCVYWYREAIKYGDITSMLALAKLYTDFGNEPAFKLSIVTNGLADNLSDFLLIIEEKANGPELYQLGEIYYNIERDKWRVIRIKPQRSCISIFEKSAEKHYTVSYLRIGEIYEERYDLENAIRYYDKATRSPKRIVALDKIAGCFYMLGWYSYEKNVCEIILKETSYRKIADKECRINAYYRLAYLYRLGLGVENNTDEAIKLYERILEECGENEINALANLAILYESQPELDSQKSKKYYESLFRNKRCKDYISDITKMPLSFHITMDSITLFCLAHAFANGICCEKNHKNALRCYFECSSKYYFTNTKDENMIKTAKSDLNMTTKDVDTEDHDNLICLGFIYYELFSDADKAKMYLTKVFERGEDDFSLLTLIDEEHDGHYKNEKRKEYYLTQAEGVYMNLQSDELLYFIYNYGWNIARNEKINMIKKSMEKVLMDTDSREETQKN
jgi:TPR repeat protein